MKITQIDVFQVSYRLHDRKYAWSGGHAETGFLSTVTKLSTDEGLTGWSEVCPLGSGYMAAYAKGLPAGISELAPVVLGHDPTRLHALNDRMDQALGGHAYVKTAIDVACWDLIGKAAGLPVCALLGGRYVDDYPLYRAMSQRAPEAMADDVARYKAEGYTRFQLKVGADPLVDIARVRASRAVLDDTDILIADANTGWRLHDAIKVVDALRDIDYYVEQPCATYEACRTVRDHTDKPFILDELMTGLAPFLRAFSERAMDAINIKISRVGGLTKAAALRDLCERLGVVMTIEDSWGGDITTAAIAHLAGSTHPDYLFTSTDFNSYVDVRIAEDAPWRENGRMRVPTAPGLGITPVVERLGQPVLTLR